MALEGFKKFFSSPEMFFRIGAKILVHIIYNLKSKGFENIPEEGGAILISNHIAYVDGLIIHTVCNRPVHFVIDENIYKMPMVKYFMDHNGAIPIAPNRKAVKLALRQVSNALKAGHLVCIFPEGRLTYTGNMSRFRFGVEWMAKRDHVPVVPIALKGLWGSIFSRKYRKSRFRYFPRSFRRKIIAACGEPVPPEKAKINHLQRVLMDLKNTIE